jgi:hypothetical protein
MRYRRALILFMLAFVLALVACDGDSPVTPNGLPSVAPRLTEVVVVPTATPIPRIKRGDEVTALEALGQLKLDALEWQKDALFIMVANVKPGQEGRLLGMALSDPDLTDLTPGGRGRNWVLLAASRSAEGVMVFDLDGERTDLVASGKVPSSLLVQLTGPGITGVAMSDLVVSGLMDSDEIGKDADPIQSDDRFAVSKTMALISPARLGIASLFASIEGKPTPDLLYEVFSAETAPNVSFFDALNGTRIRQVNHE